MRGEARRCLGKALKRLVVDLTSVHVMRRRGETLQSRPKGHYAKALFTPSSLGDASRPEGLEDGIPGHSRGTGIPSLGDASRPEGRDDKAHGS